MSEAVEIPSFAAHSRLLTTKQAMAYLGVGSRLLWKLTFSKDPTQKIPSYKVGKLRKYRYDELSWWLDNHKS